MCAITKTTDHKAPHICEISKHPSWAIQNTIAFYCVFITCDVQYPEFTDRLQQLAKMWMRLSKRWPSIQRQSELMFQMTPNKKTSNVENPEKEMVANCNNKNIPNRKRDHKCWGYWVMCKLNILKEHDLQICCSYHILLVLLMVAERKKCPAFRDPGALCCKHVFALCLVVSIANCTLAM